MYACIVPPTDKEEGVAAVYFSSPRGSQLLSSNFTKTAVGTKDKFQAPHFWDALGRLRNRHPHVKRIVDHARTLYPFLKENCAVASHTICHSIFTTGNDRRVRRIPEGPMALSKDGGISAWSSPKWTHAELVALIAVNHVCEKLGEKGKRIPDEEITGFGPKGLDLLKVYQEINFHNLKMEIGDAIFYAEQQELPRRAVDESIPQFNI